MKMIYGFEISYEKALEDSEMKTLNERGCKLAKEFALKIAKNERYQHWFSEKQRSKYELRNHI